MKSKSPRSRFLRKRDDAIETGLMIFGITAAVFTASAADPDLITHFQQNQVKITQGLLGAASVVGIGYGIAKFLQNHCKR